MLILKESEIIQALTIQEAMEVNKEAFIQQASQKAIVPPRIAIPIPEQEGVTLFKPAKVQSNLGLKVVSVRPHNAGKNLPTVPGYIFLVDEVTALAVALMDATYLTALRTAAGSALATDYLSNKDASVLAVFGAGLQAVAHIDAILTIRPITTVWIWNRTKANAVQLQQKLESKYKAILPNVQFKVSEDTKECIEHADIIVAATNSQTPLFDGKCLKKGAHINAVGSYRPTTQEIDEATILRAKIVLDTPAAVEAGDLHIPLTKGTLNKDSISGEIGDLFLGKIKVRSDVDDITFFKSVGTAVQDMATAGAIVKNAQKLGLGLSVEF